MSDYHDPPSPSPSHPPPHHVLPSSSAFTSDLPENGTTSARQYENRARKNIRRRLSPRGRRGESPERQSHLLPPTAGHLAQIGLEKRIRWWRRQLRTRRRGTSEISMVNSGSSRTRAQIRSGLGFLLRGKGEASCSGFGRNW
jgi:hypothetical protein